MVRPRQQLDDAWRFRRGRGRRGESTASAGWEDVELPHCWNTQDTFQHGVEYYRGPGVYQRDFRLPEAGGEGDQEGDERWLVVGPFYGLATVFLNDKKLGRFDGQYLGFECPVDRWLRRDADNTLRIELTNRCPSWVLPGTDLPDFLLFGGLAGGVALESRSAAHFVAGSLQVIAHDVLVSPRVTIHFETAGDVVDGISADWSIVDAAGHEVAASRVAAGARQAEITVDEGELWSVDRPALYEARGRLSAGDRVLDETRIRFGLREISFGPEGFLLNGNRVELAGFNRHECVPGLGNALPDWLHRQDARTLKDLGANFVRLSHYPQHPAFLDACDEVGLLVYSELASWKSVRGGRWLRSSKRQMEAMIRRDRNHPSIVLWGMGNESQHRGAYKSLSKLIHALDPSRPTTYAENHLYRARRARTLGLPDVWGLNYEVDALDTVREHATSGCVVVSEACNEQAKRGSAASEREQIAAIETFWQALEGKAYVAGYTLWAFNDYPTMFRDRFVRRTGKLDAWRLPKLAAWLFKARHASEPFVELIAPWEPAPDRRPVAVDLFTNCEEVELWAGNVQLSGVEPGRLHQLLSVPFVHAPLRAIGRTGGRSVEVTVRPLGVARRLTVAQEEESLASACRGLTVKVVDDDGFLVGSYAGRAQLRVAGEGVSAAFTDDGSIDMARGVGRSFALLKGGRATVTVEAEGLESGSLELTPVRRGR